MGKEKTAGWRKPRVVWTGKNPTPLGSLRLPSFTFFALVGYRPNHGSLLLFWPIIAIFGGECLPMHFCGWTGRVSLFSTILASRVKLAMYFCFTRRVIGEKNSPWCAISKRNSAWLVLLLCYPQLSLRGISLMLCARVWPCSHLRALMTRKSCAAGMRNAILRNHFCGRIQFLIPVFYWPLSLKPLIPCHQEWQQES